MRRKNVSILLLGALLGSVTVVLRLLEYRYFVGSLNTDVYTAIVAAIFTGVGIWIGINALKSKKQRAEETRIEQKVNLAKAKELKLNTREYETLQLIAKGHSNQEIADALFLALPTVKTHVSNLYSKLNVKSRTQAIHKAQSLNLI